MINMVHKQKKKEKKEVRSVHKISKKRRTLLSDKREEPKSSDYGRFDVPSDKIHVKGEPYESFETAFNKKDALTIKKTINKLGMKYLGVKFPIVIRRGYQNGVFYDLYWHRWAVIKDGKLVETYDMKLTEHPNWKKFQNETRRLVGVF